MTSTNHKIDFFIAGAAKSGTTSLYSYLEQFPEVFLPKIKENLFFARDDLYRVGPNYLDAFYHGAHQNQCIGGAYAHTIYFPHVQERLYQYNPDLKLIAILRDPVDRAYSAYWFAVRNGWETLSFQEALDAEHDRRNGGYIARAELTYLAHGLYLKQIHSLLSLFPRKQLYFLEFENFIKQPQNAMRDVLRFLNVWTEKAIEPLSATNVAGLPRFGWLQRLFLAENAWYQRLARRIVPFSTRLAFQKRVTDRIVKQWNIRRTPYPPLDLPTRKRLKKYFSSDYAEIEALTRLDLSHWR